MRENFTHFVPMTARRKTVSYLNGFGDNVGITKLLWINGAAEFTCTNTLFVLKDKTTRIRFFMTKICS